MARDGTAVVAEFNESIARVPLAMAVVDAVTHRFLATNKAADDLFGANKSITGMNFESLLRPDDRERVLADYEAVVTGRLDGYEAHRNLVTEAGPLRGRVWVRRLDLAGGPSLTTLIFVPDDMEVSRPASRIVFGEQLSDVGFIVTDHEWVVEHASPEVESILGVAGQLTGKPLLGLVRPNVAAEFLGSITWAASIKRSVVADVQMRGRSGWTHVAALVAPLCQHTPPRLGLAIAAAGASDEERVSRAQKLEQHMWRIASEVLAVPFMEAGGQAGAGPLPGGVELTPQQWEITMRLLNAQRVPQMAKEMHLSQSTVRNHLSAVFKRFDVHSQPELIAKLQEIQP